MTLRGQTEARLYDPRDYSAHVRSRWLFDRMTAVSPKHVEPFHLRMCKGRFEGAMELIKFLPDGISMDNVSLTHNRNKRLWPRTKELVNSEVGVQREEQAGTRQRNDAM